VSWPVVTAAASTATDQHGVRERAAGLDPDHWMEGPISVLVMCFDETGAPLHTPGGFLDADALDPGQEGSFSVDLFNATCPR